MLNLNDPKQFILDGVKELIASKDDSEDRQLRVTKFCLADLSNTVGSDDKEGFVGVKASNDTEWVSRIYDALRKNCLTPTKYYIDIY